jgi:hypothetical protein
LESALIDRPAGVRRWRSRATLGKVGPGTFTGRVEEGMDADHTKPREPAGITGPSRGAAEEAWQQEIVRFDELRVYRTRTGWSRTRRGPTWPPRWR